MTNIQCQNVKIFHESHLSVQYSSKCPFRDKGELGDGKWCWSKYSCVHFLMWGQHFWGSADVRRRNSWKRQLCHVETLSGLSLLSMWRRKHFTWGRRKTSLSHIWSIWNRFFFLINQMISCDLLTTRSLRAESEAREAAGLLTGSYISVSHCSDVAMLGFATVFTFLGGGWRKGNSTDKTTA